MTSEQIGTLLAQAGVDEGAVGDAERLLLPEPQVDEARTARVGLVFVPPGLANARLLHVRSDALDAAGIDAGFDEDTRALLLTASAELAFGFAAPGEPCTAGEAGGTRFHVPTDRPSAFGLWSAAGPLAIGSVDARAIELRVVHAWPAPPTWDDSGVKGNSGVDAQPNDSGVDLHSGVVRPRSRWDHTVVTGRIARGMEPGASQTATIAARRWTRELTTDQRSLIERFAVVQARGIAARLDRLQTHFGPADTSLDLTWQALCGHRDDIEGIRVLLREAQAGQALSAALGAVDELGRAVRFSWPSEVDVHDDRLQRVSEADPGAWWGSTRRQVVWL
jgi:hypothetical protein